MSTGVWASVQTFIDEKWDKEVVPSLCEYIKVENQSPAFDPKFAENGLQEKAMGIIVDWLKHQPVKGLKYELLEEKGRTPFLIVEIDGTEPTAKTLLMYGHMDKQPPLRPWAEGLDPYTPVIRDNKLYGRAGADDGYALYASVLSVLALQEQGIPHSRVCIMIEADEESGSPNLPQWLQKTSHRFGDVDLLICLDSGSLTYDRMWMTTSLRGMAALTVECSCQYEGMHSGIGGGVIPDAARILRHQLEKIEDTKTGDILVKSLHTEITPALRESLKFVNEVGWDDFIEQFPLQPGQQPEVTTSVLDLALRNFWMPCMTIIGADGIPSVAQGGNVLRDMVRFKLSLRVPPTVNAKTAAQAVIEVLEKDAPHGATVKAQVKSAASGWAAPANAKWLDESLDRACRAAFNKPPANMGMGGTIPFLNMLNDMFPKAQFVVTGVLGPKSNAHGPNEFLLIPYGKSINYCMARVVADHFTNREDKKQ
jgi:acetylornithine deacetylase/succinyl-diaminopimelate desuccinylase-like protein